MADKIIKRIDEYLVEDRVDEVTIEPNDATIKPGEYANLSTGIRRIQFRLEKANTPQKYVDAFEIVTQLIKRFPLKSKIIWQAVSQAYEARFGSAGIAPSPSSVDIMPEV